MKQIYLDNASTTPVFPEVIESISKSLESDYGNPSSLHRLGIESEKRINETIEGISETLHTSSEQVIFTSGGTEANNMAIIGLALDRHRRGKHLITSEIEHPSVLRAFEFLEDQSYDVTYLPVNNDGLISLDSLKEALRDNTILVSIMHVNNEIGSVQPIEDMGRIIKNANRNTAFHVDAVQSFGKLDLYPREWHIDLLSASGHKIHGPKGVGFLYKKRAVRIKPILFGGDQQDGLRSGTENIGGIVGLGRAIEINNQMRKKRPDHLYKLKELLLEQLKGHLPQAVFNGDVASTAGHIINISFPGLQGEVLLHALEQEGVYVGTGSACSSRDKKSSHVQKAIGIDDRRAQGSIRISTSYMTEETHIKAFVPILEKTISRIERFVRR
ncbi:MAG TPA: cysteine desulfurase family protein [Bacillota bacterium]|nr:cysteine desulfurase family protein [Bacillota bacterium]